jgi:agmatinase
MTPFGAMYGPDVTYLGVPRADLENEATWRDADAVIVGAPFDGGTSHRSG